MVVLLPGDGMRGEQGGSPETGQSDPPAPWVAFVGVLPRRFAPPITTVPGRGTIRRIVRSVPASSSARRRTWRSSHATPLSSFPRLLLPVNGFVSFVPDPETPCRFATSATQGSDRSAAPPVPRGCRDGERACARTPRRRPADDAAASDVLCRRGYR